VSEAQQTATSRVVVATIARPTGKTGVQTHFNTFLDYMRRSGRTPGLVTPFSAYPRLGAAIFAPRVFLARVSPSLDVWWYEHWHYEFLKLGLKRSLHGAGPCVVYAQCPISAKAALESRDGPHQRVVMAVHFNVSQADEWAAQVKLSPASGVYRSIQERERRVLPAVDGLIYVSDFSRRMTLEAVPAAEGVPSAVLPNFVDAPAGQRSRKPTRDLISIGTLESRKNQAFLLHVLAAAAKRGHIYTLSLVGDGPERASLVALAATLGIQEQVAFLGYQADARRLMPDHRAYVHAARMENLPLSLIEAMADGLPVFAAPVGGIPEVFDGGVEGAYWDLDDAGAAAMRLIEVMESPDLYEAQSTAASKRFQEHFATPIVASRLLQFVEHPA
jgi:glycosyltransferase involved in cell wall biosynthesis